MGPVRIAWVALSCAAVALAGACSSFEDAGTTATEDGGATDGAAPPQDGAVSSDAADGDTQDPCVQAPAAPFELYDDQDGVQAIAADDAHLYWSTSTAIKRIAVTGGPVTTFLSGQPTVGALLLTDDHVVWGQTVGSDFFARLKSSSDGVDAGAAIGAMPSPFISRGTRVYGRIYSRIYRWQPPGSNVAVLVDPAAAFSALAAASTRVCFLALPDGGSSYAVYCVEDTGSATTPQVVATPKGGAPTKLALDETSVFLLAPGAGKVLRIDLGSPAVETLLADNEPSLNEIAVRGPNVYYSTGGGLRRVANDGSCKRVLSTTSLTQFALSSSYAFYASGTKLLRVPR